MQKKFEKDSPEWLMFRDIYALIQKHYIVEESDDYWEQIVKDVAEFGEKYKGLAVPLAVAFLNYQKEQYEKIKQ